MLIEIHPAIYRSKPMFAFTFRTSCCKEMGELIAQQKADEIVLSIIQDEHYEKGRCVYCGTPIQWVIQKSVTV